MLIYAQFEDPKVGCKYNAEDIDSGSRRLKPFKHTEPPIA